MRTTSAHREAVYRYRLWGCSPHRLWPVATSVDPSAEVADVIREFLFVLRLAPRADLRLLSSKRPKKSTVVDGAAEP